MKEIKLPLIIAEGMDVQFYKEVKDAELNIEPIDAQDSVYIGYDADGKLLKIETDGVKVHIALAENKPSHRKDLKTLLERYLFDSEKLINTYNYSLELLIEKCKKHYYVPKIRR